MNCLYVDSGNSLFPVWHQVISGTNQCCAQAAAARDIADNCHVTRWLLSQWFLKITYNNTGDNKLLFWLLYQNHWLLKFLGTTLTNADVLPKSVKILKEGNMMLKVNLFESVFWKILGHFVVGLMFCNEGWANWLQFAQLKLISWEF